MICYDLGSSLIGSIDRPTLSLIFFLLKFVAAMSKLTKSMCWELVTVKNDKLNQVGAAIFKKPNSNECYEKRPTNEPPLCEESDDPDAVWYYFYPYFIVMVFVIFFGKKL